MKKIFVLTLLLSIFLFGCEKNMQTPTSKVEEFLSSYQRLDKDVLKELENIVEKEDEMTEEEKKEYNKKRNNCKRYCNSGCGNRSIRLWNSYF